MKKQFRVTSFGRGINEVDPQGAFSLTNFDVRNDGVLISRPGYTIRDGLGGIPSASGETVSKLFFASGNMFVQTNKNIYYRHVVPDSDPLTYTFSAVTNNTGLNAYGLSLACADSFDVQVADSNRVFLANGKSNLWLDTSETTPALYKWGVSAVQLSVALVASPVSFGGVPGTYGTSNGMWITPTVVSYGIGSLKPGWYAFAMAYELKHGGSSPLSIRKLVQLTEGNDTFDLALPNTGSGVDAAWAGATSTTDLDGGIDASVTTVVVGSSAKMLVGMDITVDLGGSSEEVMTITAISVTTEGSPATEVHRLTVARGANPFSHSDGEIVTFNLLDPQVTGIKIYATDRVSDVSLDELEGTEKQRAMSAPLKHIKTVKSDDTDASQTNIYYQALGLRPLAGQLEGASIPPDSLANITLYGGRIWGSVGSTDKLVFSVLDETAAPLYDLFPSDEMSESSRTHAVIPHVLNTKNPIRATAKSREYLAVFGETSIQLVKGQGIISGIYGKQQPGTDLDLSQTIDMMGANDGKLVTQTNDNIYFYSSIDNRIYRLDSTAQLTWISRPVQGLLDQWDDESGRFFKEMVSAQGKVYLLTYKPPQTSVLVYEQYRDLWTHADLGYHGIYELAENLRSSTDFSQGVYGIRWLDEVPQTIELFKEGIGADGGEDIHCAYTSNEFNFAVPTRMDQVRIGVPSETTVDLSVNVDDAGFDAYKISGYSLNANNNYSIRPFCRGYQFKVKFELINPSAQTVRFFELQFRSR